MPKDKSSGKKLADMLYGNPEGAAFGVFPQMKPKRSKQDPEAAKNFPVDLARGVLAGAVGIPGDIESLARLPYELYTGNESPTFLPTSEDVLKRIPFGTNTPAGQFASGLGTLAGGSANLGAAPRVVKQGALAAGRAGERMAERVVPGIMERGGAGADILSGLAQGSRSQVMKPKGGNWQKGSIENALKPLKRNTAAGNDPVEMLSRMRERYTPEEIAKLPEGVMKQHILNSFAELERDVALNNWVERNLGNYVKKEMATPDDPVRRLAEEGIVHVPPDQVGMNRYRAGAHRSTFGGQREGVSEEARAWEDSADVAISPYTVGEIKKAKETDGPLSGLYEPWMDKADEATEVYKASKELHPNYLGFDHIMDVLREDVNSGRIRPEQLSKVSMEQAVRRTYEYDQEMAKKMREAQIKATEGMPVYREYPEGYRWIELAAPDYNKLPIEERKQIIERLRGEAREKGVSPEDYIEKYPESILSQALKYEGDTMGHCVGGYCPDVMEGRSRIFSLRDAKGEPHVTVEVEPNQHLDYNQWYGEQPTSYKALLNAKRSEPGYDPYQEPAYLAAREALPPKIVQIKGKQNRAPKEDYLPFVQDFVRSGQWDDVGDLGNTGLIDTRNSLAYQNVPSELWKAHEQLIGKDAPRYMTQEELRKYLPPEEGMAQGGSVHFSDNPDVMQLELAGGGAIRMQAGGLPKRLIESGAKALKALKPAKEAVEQVPEGVEPIVVKPADRAAAGRKAAELIKSQPPIKASEALGQAMERGFKKTATTQADRTRVGGGNIGGGAFSAISEADPAYAGKVWGVMDKNTATRLTNLTDPETAWTTMLGSATQLKTNPIVFDKLKKAFLDSMKAGNLSPELESKINHNLAITFGEGADIRDPKIWKQADTFEKRAALADLMMGQGLPPKFGGVPLGGEKSGKGVIFRPTDILKRETEPGLLHPEHGGTVPTFAAGPRLFRIDPETEFRPDLHPGFPTLLSGKDLGVNMIPTPTEIYLPDYHRKFKERNPNRKPSYYDLALGTEGEGLPSQNLNDEFIRHLIREGFKEGGAVRKAAGGEITADDLILEERKL